MPWPFDPVIMKADFRALLTERRDLMPGNEPPWGPMVVEPFEDIITPLSPEDARIAYGTALGNRLVALGMLDQAMVGVV